MISEIIKKSLVEIYKYLNQNYSKSEMVIINKELGAILPINIEQFIYIDGENTYEDIQSKLSSINEKESIRKKNGVYYTPNDVVRFIYANAIKALYGNLKCNNLHVQDLNGIPYKSFSFGKSVFDPTCGAGEFLLVALSIKFDLLDLHQTEITNKDICKVLATIYGNDINNDSILITKFRMFLYILNRYGVEKIEGIANVLSKNFDSIDFINLSKEFNKKYDIIIGNPPYVEDSKCDTIPLNKYGNVYANVLENVSNCLNNNGVLGFIIPLSYVSTPRMKKIRTKLNDKLCEQYILSYCDRPDCLFTSVHQKLCILIGKYKEDVNSKKIYTSNYQFWYKEERETLFSSVPTVLNKFVEEDYIPKAGTHIDLKILNKISLCKENLYDTLSQKNVDIYVNMRAAFWIKAFLQPHTSGEYKVFKCIDTDHANLCMCLLNSSLFWWYWICVSDCWHITSKELKGFKVPNVIDFTLINKLAKKIEQKLEKTKVYVGTKQTEYEYKHKKCIKEIHEIDDLICSLYGLTEEETLYIKNFAYRYRVSGGIVDENN